MALRCAAVVLTAVAGTALFAAAHIAAEQPAAVRGRVTIGIPIAARRAVSTYSRSIQTATLAPISELRNVVVYIKDAPRRPQTAVHAEIRQQNETFIPRVVAVPVGSVVDFPNDDSIYHNVFSLSRTRTFNLGRYPHGQTRPVQFDKPGLVKVFCEIHSHMSATVMVFDHPWFAVPAADGRFDLPGVPPGDRQITAWHERLGDTTLTVHVDPGGTVTTDFVLPVPERQ